MVDRSLGNFKINQPHDRMPEPIVRAFGILKGAAATVNMNFGLGIYNLALSTTKQPRAYIVQTPNLERQFSRQRKRSLP